MQKISNAESGFKEENGITTMIDQLQYGIPFGIFGKLLMSIFSKKSYKFSFGKKYRFKRAVRISSYSLLVPFVAIV